VDVNPVVGAWQQPDRNHRGNRTSIVVTGRDSDPCHAAWPPL